MVCAEGEGGEGRVMDELHDGLAHPDGLAMTYEMTYEMTWEYL